MDIDINESGNAKFGSSVKFREIRFVYKMYMISNHVSSLFFIDTTSMIFIIVT